MASAWAVNPTAEFMSPPGISLVRAGRAIGNEPPCVIMKKIVRSETLGILPSALASLINLDNN